MPAQTPIIAITMGDPAGIGPEVTARALKRPEIWRLCRPVVVGDLSIANAAADLVGAPAFHGITSLRQARFCPEAPDLLDVQQMHIDDLRPGRVAAPCGEAAAAYIARAVALCKAGEADALTTGPINKAALKEAGVPFIGHTELLASLLGDPEVTTMLATTGLRVVHVTRHVPFAQIARYITRKNVLETIKLTDAGLRQMGIALPRIAVAALNPHGGDEGLMGREEIDAIGPAVRDAQQADIDAYGPIPADSVFFRAIRGEFDVVVAMYHDQGHIPIKTHGFERSVTVTLGLPIIRTSVDHGTAFDIAWQGTADDESMVEALRLAAQLAEGKRAGEH
ncbi:MAG: 4-hydroxythreonine-4-phosphate dehydrogenase PdxA [Anaerolineae bacterium]|jgi:4-hydroxythreonine-4-phosphate dehydrogenase|nr:4-hydroxythreonine-4-phosphate dehydrogenase PdxA [Chloroflexota bacterium]